MVGISLNTMQQQALDRLIQVSRAQKTSHPVWKYKGLCPAHEDKRPSLSFGIDEKGRICLKCHAGCDRNAVIQAAGLTPADLVYHKPKMDRNHMKARNQGVIDQTYDYVDEHGGPLYQVVRYKDPKGFCQRRWNGENWAWNMNGIRRVLYHLDEIVQSDPSLPVYIVEGEKDADRLRSLGLMATCNPNGAGQWRDEYNAPISGHPVVIIPDHDVPGRRHAEQVAGSLHGHAASVKILHLPGLPDKGDVSDWLDAGGTKDELERLVEQTPAWEPAAGVQAGWTTPSGFSTQSTSSFVRYQETEKGLVYLKGNESGYTPVPLCNFTVRIREEIVRDNGVEQQTHLVVEGKLSDGSLLPSVRIPSSRLANLSWVTELWGVRAIVYAGQNIKDHLRVAIQTLSQNVEHRTVYTHLGWRNIGDDWIYLHSGGAIGPHGGLTDIHVEMEGRLDLYSLPHPPTGRELREAVQASLGFLELAPYRITYPLLSAVYRSLLGEAQRIDCSVFLAGQTGSQKSELSAMALAHFGSQFTSRTLPGNWASTANALEKMAFMAKDAVLVIDDFAPTGSTSDVARLHREADRLLRGQGNRSGRLRMRADSSLQSEYFPRGLILSSGEDIPRGESLRARLLILEIAPGEVDLDRLTQTQDHAMRGILAQATAGYLQYLASKMVGLKHTVPHMHLELRDRLRQGAVHARIPDIGASLLVGWRCFLDFAREIDAITDEQTGAHWQKAVNAFQEAISTQKDIIAEEEVTQQFLDLISSAIDSGKAHLANYLDNTAPEGHESQNGWELRTYGVGDNARSVWHSKGDCIGWIEYHEGNDEPDIYLEPDAIFACAQRIGHDQGISLPINKKTLWKRMQQKGLLASRDVKRRRNTIRKTINEMRKDVIHIKGGTLSRKNVPNVPIVPMGQNPSENWDFEVGRLSDSSEKTSPENVPKPSDRPASGTQGTFGTVMEDEIAGLLQNGEDNEEFLADELSFPEEPENTLNAGKIVEVF